MCVREFPMFREVPKIPLLNIGKGMHHLPVLLVLCKFAYILPERYNAEIYPQTVNFSETKLQN